MEGMEKHCMEKQSTFSFSANMSLTDETVKQMRDIAVEGIHGLRKTCYAGPNEKESVKHNFEVVTLMECHDDCSSIGQSSDDESDTLDTHEVELPYISALIDSLDPYKIYWTLHKGFIINYMSQYIKKFVDEQTYMAIGLCVKATCPDAYMYWDDKKSVDEDEDEEKHSGPVDEDEDEEKHSGPVDEDEVVPSSGTLTSNDVNKIIHDSILHNDELLKSLGMTPDIQQNLTQLMGNMFVNGTNDFNPDIISLINNISLACYTSMVEEVYDPTGDEIQV
jgi:ferredoxin